MMEIKEMNLYNMILLANSYGTLIPEQAVYFNDISPELHEKL